jgi:hypothetical protein
MKNLQFALNNLHSKSINAKIENNTIYVIVGDSELEISDSEIDFQSNEWVKNNKPKYKYFDLHVFLSRNKGYSLGVKIETENEISEDEVIEYAEKNDLFTESGDGSMVDCVDEIGETEFKIIYPNS